MAALACPMWADALAGKKKKAVMRASARHDPTRVLTSRGGSGAEKGVGTEDACVVLGLPMDERTRFLYGMT